MFITDENIREKVGDVRNYLWARRHFDDRHFLEDLTIEFSQNQYKISAKVKDYNKSQNLTITLDENKKVIDYGCTCNFSYFDSACGHVAALLMLINRLNPKSFPYKYNDIDAQTDLVERTRLAKIQLQQAENRKNELLARETIKNLSLSIEQTYTELFEKKDIYHIVTQADFRPLSNSIELNFRLGSEKLYIIKNLAKLFQSIDYEEYHIYGKNLAFTHRMNAFDEFTQDTLKLVRQFTYNENNRSDERYISIYDEGIDAFFDHFYDCDSQYLPVSLIKEPQMISLNIETNKDMTYNVTLVKEDSIIATRKNVYHATARTLTRISEDSNSVLASFVLFIKEHNFNRIHPDDFKDFKELLASLNEYLDIEEFTTKTQTQFETKNTLYVDISAEEIIMKMECNYENEVTKNPQIDNDAILTLGAKAIFTHLSTHANSVYTDTFGFDIHTDTAQQLIFTDLEKMKEFCDVYISDTVKAMFKSKKVSLQVGVGVRNGLLEIDLSSLNFDAKEIQDVMQAFQMKKKYHRLKNGELLSLEQDALHQLEDTLAQFNVRAKDIDHGKIKLPLFRAFDVENLSHSSEFEFTRQASFTHLIDVFSNTEHTDNEIDKQYEGILRPYQEQGVKWMMKLSKYGFGGILADDMGLGKTIQVLALLESTPKIMRTIVVCPAVLLYNWEDEVKKFSDKIKSICIAGTLQQRQELVENLTDETLIITTYDYLRNDTHLYDNLTFDFVILDEAQYIKNHTTKSAQAVKKLQGVNRIALTGTPIENSLAELWSIFDFLMPNYLYSYSYFQSKFERPIILQQDQKAQQNLKAMVEPFILRRTKKEVLFDLPDKIEQTLILDFSEHEKNLYLAKLATFNKDLQDQIQIKQVNKVLILTMLTQLRQICCDTRLIADNEPEKPSSKLIGCMKLIEDQILENKKILVFSSFTSMLSLIETELKKRYIHYGIITGDVSKENRKITVDSFQEGNIPVLLISLKAGGVGLNLTAANTVIHYDPWWNVSVQNQATDRAYRIGQKQDVQVFKIIMKDSIEEKIMKMQERKKGLVDIFVEGNKGSIASMNVEQIKELFSNDK